MTREEIIQIAKKCGWDNPATNMMPLYEFAKLVAEHERNACAQEAERTFYSVQAAENIRARGQE